MIERLLGGTSPQLVAYAAEQSATFACRAPAGTLLAYAKVQRGDAEHRACHALAAQTPSASPACSPPPTASSCSNRSTAPASTTPAGEPSARPARLAPSQR